MAQAVNPHLSPRRLVWLAVALAAAGALVASGPVHAAMQDVVAWANAFIRRAPAAGMAVFVVLSAASAMFAFLSTSLLAPVAIAAWGNGTTFVLLWIGWLLGGALTYGVGRYLGRSAAAALAGGEALAKAEAFVHDRARIAHLLLFQIAMPSEILGYVLGLVRYRFVYYLGVLALTELPYALAVVYLGESFLEGRVAAFVGLGALVLATSAALYAVMNRLGRNRILPP